MTVRELYEELNIKIPKALSFDWDNDGLMCCADGEKQVKRVLITLDVTSEIAEIAIKGEYDVIISHHPFIFKGLKALDCLAHVPSKVIELLKNDVAVMSFHTRLDCVSGGVNDTLCELLELCDVSELLIDGLPLGRIGTLPASIDAEEFAEDVKAALGAPIVLLSDAGVKAHKVAVVGGSGGDMIAIARNAGADTFVSGRVGYHEMTDIPDEKQKKMNMIEAGHFYTEFPVCDTLLDWVCEIDENIECDICNSNVIKAI